MMRNTLRIAALAALLSATPAFALDKAAPKSDAMPQMNAEQQAMMAAWQKAGIPGAQHKQLAEHFVGKWTTKQTMWMDPAAPPMTETGTSVEVAVLGGRQVRTDFSSQWMGQPFEGVGYTGYDNVTGKYVSTWTDNSSTSVLVSHGDYDAATSTYTFHGEMADPMKTGAKTPVRQTLHIVDADHHVWEMYESRDGKEARTMQIEYVRTKS